METRPRDKILLIGDKLLCFSLQYFALQSSTKSLTMSRQLANSYLVVQLFILYSTVVMQQSLDLSGISLLGRDKVTYKIFVLHSMELMKFIAVLAISIPGIAQTIYTL